MGLPGAGSRLRCTHGMRCGVWMDPWPHSVLPWLLQQGMGLQPVLGTCEDVGHPPATPMSATSAPCSPARAPASLPSSACLSAKTRFPQDGLIKYSFFLSTIISYL